MSAEAFAKSVPPVVTLNNLTAMIEADEYGHRFELSAEGVVTITLPPDAEHAGIASDLFAWLLAAGWPPRQILQAVGIRISLPEGDGGRIPDVTLWTEPPQGVWPKTTRLVLAIEIVSPSSRTTDREHKVKEYARAGIPHYWVVDRDPANTVTLYRSNGSDDCETATKLPLAWLLQSAPGDHLPPAS
ncbi:Uma2 family endonuclease [Actinoplanes oblitus]|uniref:Uma2 family endonuclease n=1 Tax=Actinoplanes oblitus TaxID=3040509 RepID=A0ABY8WNE7_9ACTN|nr:Uma2 family endonuclease [Actinoplanes oblitus]WIM97305.1 Uma2 family endonuclease [Actinoplanes oblitus]